ncbi:type VI secretion protein IcmF [Leptothrix cholodnii SP-6]|uniref:Type VI secretion protein IcmF n=1 Tax=Leptothrix cholodnii (strain ATCC 51168 / LMG 8142 / SP-6) TaxID=395495 RepID=B1XWW0_LEPCP|nr:type VI secretion system membrane subunit TssM [Leptothrix cholodnii]ACB36309.1 type VI secretion protein IcmF [Leptothrix cholodnii SP-6]
MKTLLGWIFNRWTLAVVALLALSLLIWIVGPLIAVAEVRPLDSTRSRLMLIGCLVLALLLMAAWSAWQARRANRSVVEQLMKPAAGGAPAGSESPDVAAMRQRFERALQVLREARFPSASTAAGGAPVGAIDARGKPAAPKPGLLARLGLQNLGGRYLYQLPWYLIIGAPGSGKTTALRNAGLQFPLAELTGEHRVRGVGGTRDCDWWFTDRAVLIDTAGRFTTQDSDAGRDQGAWSGFLGLLRQSRPRQPINGVLVTVSVPDLLGRSAAERDDYAARVRLRLQELHKQLGVRFPVYLLVTKVDLLNGFGDYFATLDKDSRATPWGTTFTLAQSRSGDHTALAPELKALTQRLQDGLVERLQAETDPQRRARIYGFPLQFGSLHEPLDAFVRDAFAPSPFEPPSLLRGVYFVSGTQEGTPIDRLMGSIARSWQLERAILPPQGASARSYFLERLLGEVVFAEAGLAGTDPRGERRRRLMLVGAYAALGLLTAGALAAWATSAVNNRNYVDAVLARVDEVRRLVQATPNRASPDLQPLLPALAATRQLAQAGWGDAAVPWSLGFGLFQGDKLDAASRSAYQRMLVDAVLPRLALRIEEQLRQRADAPELQYESLKAYLMLHDPQRFDADALAALVRADWAQNLPREVGTAEREQLDQHLDALLALGPAVSPLPQDQALVTQTRALLAAVPLPQRIYNRLRHQGLGEQVAEFTAARAGGPAAALVFARASGAPLTRGVPGLYTRDGYQQGFQRKVDAVTRELADEETWVLGNAANGGGGAAGQATRPSAATLADDVRRLYLTDYANTWEAFIADVRLRPTQSLAELVQVTRVLSGPDNPLATLLKAVVRETTLLGGEEPGAVKAAADRARGAVAAVREGIRALGGDAAAAALPARGVPLESIVDDRFAMLRRYVQAAPGARAPIDDTLVLLNEVQLHLASVELAVRSANPPPPSDLPVRLGAEGARSAEPVRSLLGTLGRSSAGFTGLMQREVLSREVRSMVGDFCTQAVAGRYPLRSGSATDVTLADFGQLFGPGGRFDRLFQEKLAAHVDTSARPTWRFRANGLGEDAGTLAQFQRAQVIRDTFFPAGGNTPQLRLEFKPVEMDASISQFVLDIDGQVVRYAHGPQIPTSVQWPGPRGTNQVRLQLSPAGASGNGLLNEGPWALLHLFDRVQLEPGRSAERFRATFELDGRKAVFEITASSVRNPLRLRELAEFSCPNGL